MKKIVDFFPYFDPTGKEILELRINMLKDYVDEFIICESNKTQSGIPIEYNLRKRIKELNLPEEKIKIIDLNIPEDSDLIIEDIDIHNCAEDWDIESSLNKNNLNSLRGRVRERMQKDSLLLVLDDYDDDTVFIHSDSDEIIKPEVIEWVSSMCKQYQETIIKIPLVHLEGRADLRVYFENENIPRLWAGGMFFATKSQLKISTPAQIRSCVFNKFSINHLTQDGNIIHDLGWHFSWMGNGEKRIEKSKSFCHYDDISKSLIGNKHNSEEFQNRLLENTPEEGKIPPSGIKNTILKKYPIENLPKEIFELPRVKNFLLPEQKTFKISKKFNTLGIYYTDPTPDSDWGVIETNKFSLKENQRKSFFVVDNFYDDPYAVREFALQQTYFPGEGAVGSRTRKQFLFEGVKERFEEIMGIKIAEHTKNGQGWKDGGINGRFQTCTAGTPLVYHCDSQQWAGMIYLTPDAPPQCGTSFFRHKETKIKHNSEINWEIGEGNKVFNQHTFLDGTPYELIDKIGNVFNRLVIFNGGLIHSASEYFGWDIPSSRLFHMFFFDAET